MVLEEIPATYRAVSDSAVSSLASDIERTGYGVIPDYVSPAHLMQMKHYVSEAVGKAGGRFTGRSGAAAMAGSGLDTLSETPEFRSIFQRLYAAGTGRSAPPVEFYQILRCLTGKDAEVHSLNFHYDSFIITALLPIEIPSEGRRGDLIMLPNTRKVRSTYMANLADKVLLDNPATQKVLRLLWKQKRLPLTRLSLTPGNLYFFWGYRSIHTNEACDPDKVRATALFHYVDPHATSRLKMLLRRH